jgi:hypothetical protein
VDDGARRADVGAAAYLPEVVERPEGGRTAERTDVAHAAAVEEPGAQDAGADVFVKRDLSLALILPEKAESESWMTRYPVRAGAGAGAGEAAAAASPASTAADNAMSGYISQRPTCRRRRSILVFICSS